MGFGRNPYVAKAQAAEQKAADAEDEASRVRAYRDAAHQWDRAAERERPGKLRVEYEDNAAKNRGRADGDPPEGDSPAKAVEQEAAPPPTDPMLLN